MFYIVFISETEHSNKGSLFTEHRILGEIHNSKVEQKKREEKPLAVVYTKQGISYKLSEKDK